MSEKQQAQVNDLQKTVADSKNATDLGRKILDGAYGAAICLVSASNLVLDNHRAEVDIKSILSEIDRIAALASIAPQN